MSEIKTKAKTKFIVCGLVLFFCLIESAIFAEQELPIVSATASSYYGGYTPEKAIDKILSTYWKGGPAQSWWLMLDLGKPYMISKISVFWNKDYGAKNYNFQTSNDGTNWINLSAQALSSEGGTTDPYQKDFPVTLLTSYRYIRLYIGKAQFLYPTVYEIKAYTSQDITKPVTPTVTDDGVYTSDFTKLHAKWSSLDPESGVVEYQYCVGTSAGNTSVIGWTTTTATEVTLTGLNLNKNSKYWFSVKAKNKIGLWSDIGSSDGIGYKSPPNICSFSPVEKSTFTEGDSIKIYACAVDSTGGARQFQISIDGAIKAPWSAETGMCLCSMYGSAFTYYWQTNIGNSGFHRIKIEVRGSYLLTSVKESTIYIYRKPNGPPL